MYTSIPQRILSLSEEIPNKAICYTKNKNDRFQAVSYADFMSDVCRTAFFLSKQCKVGKKDHVGLICENRKEWLECDLAILSLSAADVPRGTDTKISEIAFILKHSQVKGAIFEKSSIYTALQKEDPELCAKLEFVIFLDNVQKKSFASPKSSTHFYTYSDIEKFPIKDSDHETIKEKILAVNQESLATIIYTSGTTNEPKGACITHKNFLFQIDRLVPERLNLTREDILLSVLPIWHIFEREVNYVAIGVGTAIAYSKPIGAVFLEDIKQIVPSYLTSVPRIWEGVYSAIHKKMQKESVVKRGFFAAAKCAGKVHNYATHLLQGSIPPFRRKNAVLDLCLGIPLYVLSYLPQKVLDSLVFKKVRLVLGKKFKAGISGGGALPKEIDNFFQAARIKILNGYGLTETAPVIAVRNEKKPEYTGVGKVLRDIQYKVVDEQNRIIPYGSKGTLFVKSHQVMQGYYRNEAETKRVLSSTGWLNTGDLVCASPDGDLQILGRVKNTIVLSNGKNVEPEFIENTLCQSPFIDNAMVLGQDRKNLSALIIPNQEALEEYAREKEIRVASLKDLCDDSRVYSLIQGEIRSLSSALNHHERVVKFAFIPKAFKVGEELTQTLKLKRRELYNKYKKEIEALLKS